MAISGAHFWAGRSTTAYGERSLQLCAPPCILRVTRREDSRYRVTPAETPVSLGDYPGTPRIDLRGREAQAWADDRTARRTHRGRISDRPRHQETDDGGDSAAGARSSRPH